MKNVFFFIFFEREREILFISFVLLTDRDKPVFIDCLNSSSDNSLSFAL